MMKKIFLLVLMFIFVVSVSVAQEVSDSPQQDSDVPDNVKISLDALLKTRTSNQVFNMKFLNDFYFALQSASQKVYASVLFSASLDDDALELKKMTDEKYKQALEKYHKFVEQKKKEIEEENKKIEIANEGKQKSKKSLLKTWEQPPAPEKKEHSHFHNLYLRVVKDGNTIHKFKSPVPYDKKKSEYFSFGLILEPGKYDILININRFDDSQDGTLLIELNVPQLTLMDLVKPLNNIENSAPIFYKTMKTATSVEKRFTVLKNQYQVGQQIFEPVVGKEIVFKATDTPILTFFVTGAAKMQNNQPQWNITPRIEIKQGKKKIVIFKTDLLKAPYFFQKLEFKRGDKLLPAGDYTLHVELNDNNSKGKKVKIEVLFKISG
jgi:hypothetical protein